MTLELAAAGLLGAGAILYAVLGGADFGAGIWQLSPRARASEKEWNLIYRAIGPTWEANHVWLIFIFVVMFGAFPTAFAGLCRALWIPLLLGLLGIVFRGVGLTFRAQGGPEQKGWAMSFAFSSAVAAFCLGAAPWALASGLPEVAADGQFGGSYLTGWVRPIVLFGGFFAVAVCAFLAAVHLAREARLADDEELADAWRRRATTSAFVVAAFGLAGLLIVSIGAPATREVFFARSWPFVVLFLAAPALCMWALHARRFGLAVVAVAATVAAMILGWGIAQYPAIIPPNITIDSAKSPRATLQAMTWAVALGSLALVPSLVFLFTLFKSKRAA